MLMAKGMAMLLLSAMIFSAKGLNRGFFSHRYDIHTVKISMSGIALMLFYLTKEVIAPICAFTKCVALRQLRNKLASIP